MAVLSKITVYGMSLWMWGAWGLVLLGLILVVKGLAPRGCLRVLLWLLVGMLIVWWARRQGILPDMGWS